MAFLTQEALCFWVWNPKTKKLVNPKYAAKDTPDEQFKYAMRFYKKGDYVRAAEEFKRLAETFEHSELAPEAQYYAGRAYEEAGKFYIAFQNYQKTIELYPFTKRIAEIIEREYKIGNELFSRNRGKLMGIELMTDLDRAIEIFQKIKENAPFGEYADRAQFMIGQCYKKSMQYNEAKDAFQKLLDEYPDSRLYEKARYEVAYCTYLASLKSDYDQELTEKAIREFKEVARLQQSGIISEEAEKTISVLEEKKAESLFKIAEFYKRQKKTKSALLYYREILKKYPNTKIAELVNQSIDKLTSKK